MTISDSFSQLSRAMAVATLFAVLIGRVASAQEGDDGHGHNEPHRNFIAGFVGITGEERRDRALTLGLEYERRLSKRFGVGAGIEHALGDLDFTIVTFPFSYHAGSWKWSAGPGVETSDHHENEFLFRMGVERSFELGDYELAPKFNIDFIHGDVVLVGGLVFGRGF